MKHFFQPQINCFALDESIFVKARGISKNIPKRKSTNQTENYSQTSKILNKNVLTRSKSVF